MDGIAKAKAKGVQFGRKPALTEKQQVTIQRLREKEGFTVSSGAKTRPLKLIQRFGSALNFNPHRWKRVSL